MSIGIYKIVSPSGRVYIGQSVDIGKRFDCYKKKGCKNQIRLHLSFKKYGAKNHKFEVLEECEIDMLNERERYFQDHYDCTSSEGLNCKLTSTTEKRAAITDGTRTKMRAAKVGKKQTIETILKRNIKVKGAAHHCYGKPVSEVTKEKLRLANKGKFSGVNHPQYGTSRSIETKMKISMSNKGRFLKEKSPSFGKKISEGTKQKQRMKKLGKTGEMCPNSKIILNTQNGIFYFGIKSAADSINKSKHALSRLLNNKNKKPVNNPFVYV